MAAIEKKRNKERKEGRKEASIGEEVEKLGPLYIAGGNAKHYSGCRKQCGYSSKN